VDALATAPQTMGNQETFILAAICEEIEMLQHVSYRTWRVEALHSHAARKPSSTEAQTTGVWFTMQRARRNNDKHI
jgi:hypothetical protein